MKRKTMQLEWIEYNRPVTMDQGRAFYYNLQKGLLLALREWGRLNLMQYRQAEEMLRAQFRQKEKGQ